MAGHADVGTAVPFWNQRALLRAPTNSGPFCKAFSRRAQNTILQAKHLESSTFVESPALDSPADLPSQL